MEAADDQLSGDETKSLATLRESSPAEAVPSPGGRRSLLSRRRLLPDHCFNGVQDLDDNVDPPSPIEDAADCGGPCDPCHCFNLEMDGNEIGVDCGGDCSAPCHVSTCYLLEVPPFFLSLLT